MDLDFAKSKFLALLHELNAHDKSEFVRWISESVADEVNYGDEEPAEVIQARRRLHEIALGLRQFLSLDGVLPSESITHPTVGKHADFTSTNTQCLDLFLYDETDEEELIEQGKVPKARCLQCGSTRTEEIHFVSHSFSKRDLEFVFRSLLPPLDDLRILDVGSRTGAVLYAAHLFTKASKIVGIEINKDFCDLSTTTIKKLGMQDRVEIINDELKSRSDVVSSSDVIVLNNVFDWFVSPEEQKSNWEFLYSTVQPGTFLVTDPTLKSDLSDLNVSFNPNSWVEKLLPSNPNLFFAEEIEKENEEIALFRVI